MRGKPSIGVGLYESEECETGANGAKALTHSQTDNIGDVACRATLCGLQGVGNMNLLAGGDVFVDVATVADLGLWAWDGGAHLWMSRGVGERGPVGGRR